MPQLHCLDRMNRVHYGLLSQQYYDGVLAFSKIDGTIIEYFLKKKSDFMGEINCLESLRKALMRYAKARQEQSKVNL